jgi:hypothetical protein
MTGAAERGSQKWLQVAINQKQELLLGALQRSGAIGHKASVVWHSPLKDDGYREYRDVASLGKAELAHLKKPLDSFWPSRGPVWDAIGITSEGSPIFLEAKAHIPEAASPSTKASSPRSVALIKKSLSEARRWYSRRREGDWGGVFYQYANRLAHQYFLRGINGIPSSLIFLYFLNADDMRGPKSEEEWHGAIRLIHAVLGVPEDLTSRGVFDAFLDVRPLQNV